MIPVASSRRMRSATAGGVSPTRRPRSAYELRAFSWSAQSNAHPVSSSSFSGSLVIEIFYLLFAPQQPHLLWESHSHLACSFLSYHHATLASYRRFLSPRS